VNAQDRRGNGLRDESGAAIIIVMMFCLIFLIMGLALYWLSTSQIRSTETERSDVKSFNVAEAGVDAGMLALQLDWPVVSGDEVVVGETELMASLREDNATLWLASRAEDVDEAEREFVQVAIYDNSVDDGATTVTTPPDPSLRLTYDANRDGLMYVDATSNVDNDRHRILVMAEKQKWDLTFPENISLYASAIDSNGQGLGIEIEDGAAPVYYDVHDSLGKGIDPGSGVQTLPTVTTFESIFTDSLHRALLGMAISQGTFFTDAQSAENFLLSDDAPGSVVYLKSTTAVYIEGREQIGTVDDPVIMVIDTPSGSVNTWDMRGSADFYGIVVTVGNSTLRGTCSVHGAMYCSGTLLNKGTGSTAELNYNLKVIKNLNRQYVISVNIVPNTWEEYALPTETASIP
jgi:hypothetical protein